jgi:pimeloyl-ACP methyl ester carboxylesterase
MRIRTLFAPLLALAIPASAVAAPPPIAAAPAFKPTRFSVVVQGSGPDVILIPGLTGSRDVWKGTVAALPGYRYHLVQVAGFAGTAPAGNAKGQVVAPLAEEIARYIGSRRLRQPAIVGHSMGGTVAMMVAARHPALVGQVMVVDMLPQPAGLLGGTASGMRGLAEALKGLSSTESGRQVIQSAIRMFGTDEAQARGSDSDVVARATHELATTDLTRELPKIRAPLTVLYASPADTRSALIDRTYRAAYAPRPKTKLVRIDRSGHMIMYSQPARFRAELKAFLAAP